MVHERKLEGRTFIRIAHGLSKSEAQKRAKRERGRKHQKSLRVIEEGNTYSVFLRVRR